MTVILASIAKLQSIRCPHKLVRPLHGGTLFQRHLRMLMALGNDSPGSVRIVGSNEPELLSRVKHLHDHINCVARPLDSLHGTSFGDIWGFLRPFVPHESDAKVVWINPCCPFLRLGTVQAALRGMGSHALSIPVRLVETPLWDATGRAISTRRHPSSASSQCLTLSHAYWIRTAQAFFDALDSSEAYTQQHMAPHMHKIEQIEALDVDSEADFLIADAMAAYLDT